MTTWPSRRMRRYARRSRACSAVLTSSARPGRWSSASAPTARGGAAGAPAPRPHRGGGPGTPAVHGILIHPGYAGVFAYGRSKTEKRMGAGGNVITRQRRLPRDQWAVMIPGHHLGYISLETYDANIARLAAWLCQPELAPLLYFYLAPPGAGRVRVVAL